MKPAPARRSTKAIPYRPRIQHWLSLGVGCTLASTSLNAAENSLAFPEAQGFGAFAAGGRGGQTNRVTTLKATGPGSIAEAVNAIGPRIVQFDVGGVIDLEGRVLRIKEPFLTIDGQTAPSPGITLVRGGVELATHDVVVRHIAVRTAEAGNAKKSGWETDAIGTVGASYVMVDHCSCVWATDENLSASGLQFTGGGVQEWRNGTSHHVTFSHCIIAEGLSRSTHRKGEHSKGSLIHDNATFISLIANLYASNMERNPLTKGGVTAVIVNNWIANPGRLAIHNSLVAEEWGQHPPIASRLAIVGNLMEYGPDSRPRLPLFLNHRNSPLELFLADNLAFDREHNPVSLTSGNFSKLDAPPLWPAGLTPLPASKVKEFVARNAGARPWDRDPIDQRIVQVALEGKGRIIDSEQAVGGYPKRAATVAPAKKAER
jgi:hypothetical protein